MQAVREVAPFRFDRPPPKLAELPVTVQSDSVSVPRRCTGRRRTRRGVAADGAAGQRQRAAAVIQAAAEEAVAAGDRQARERRRPPLSWNTRLLPPPLTVSRFAPGPTIVVIAGSVSTAAPAGQGDRLRRRAEDGRVEA